MNTATKFNLILALVVSVLVAGGIIATGGDYLTALGVGLGSMMLVTLGRPIGSCLLKAFFNGTPLYIVIMLTLGLLLVVATAALLTSGMSQLGQTIDNARTPEPTSTSTYKPLGATSSLMAAEQWINVLYGDRADRVAFRDSGKRAPNTLAKKEPLSNQDLALVTARLGITPTAAITNPHSTLRYIQNTHNYSVHFKGDLSIVHDREIEITSDVTVVVYYMPPMEIVNGQRKTLTSPRLAYVIVHRDDASTHSETVRDRWYIAGMVLVEQ